jgi:hypothetical protein
MAHQTGIEAGSHQQLPECSCSRSTGVGLGLGGAELFRRQVQCGGSTAPTMTQSLLGLPAPGSGTMTANPIPPLQHHLGSQVLGPLAPVSDLIVKSLLHTRVVRVWSLKHSVKFKTSCILSLT